MQASDLQPLLRDVRYYPTLPVASSSWLQAIQSMEMSLTLIFLSRSRLF